MIRNVALLVLLLAAIGAYTFYDDLQGSKKDSGYEKPSSPAGRNNRPAPDFSFRSLDGKNHALSDFKGTPVVLNFWATWCAPCVVEFPQMLELAKSRNDAVFIFLSLDDDQKDLERFLKKYGKILPLPNVRIGLDRDKTISQTMFQTIKLPETYLIDHSQQITDKIIGNSVDWDSPGMREKIRSLGAPL
jgi:thiol-disulfide isomerase/thioredoxin